MESSFYKSTDTSNHLNGVFGSNNMQRVMSCLLVGEDVAEITRPGGALSKLYT